MLLTFGSMRQREAMTASTRRGSMGRLRRAASDTHDLAEVTE